MIKKNLKTLIITSIITLMPIIAGLILWDKLPESVPTHFGINGEADGFSSKTFAVFALPLFLLAVHWVCTIGTSLDPKIKNIDNKPLTLVFWICPMVSLLVSTVVYASAMDIKLDVGMIMSLFFGVLFIIIGNYLPKCKQNYTVGIKIPWTLNSEENWNYTHRTAGKLWVAGGILIIFTSLFRIYWIFAAITLTMVIIPVILSYAYHKKHAEG